LVVMVQGDTELITAGLAELDAERAGNLVGV
jgi:hypothetical protein